jgi:hypothetical protein
MVGSLALSFQSSSTRRFSSSVWMSYVGLETAEAAIAEAAHFLRPEDVFPEARFGKPPAGVDFTTHLLKAMIDDRLDLLDPGLKEYRAVKRSDGSEAYRMLTAFRFPAGERPVRTSGLAAKLARENPGVKLVPGADLSVSVRPLSFRREYYEQVRGWVNWGVVQFRTRVAVSELSGTVIHELRVDRRFTMKPAGPGVREILKVSSRNLRTTATREG